VGGTGEEHGIWLGATVCGWSAYSVNATWIVGLFRGATWLVGLFRACHGSLASRSRDAISNKHEF
jgi:hypothetical protein